MNKLIKIDRLAAWLLFIAMLLYFISGYGLTKGIISPSLAGKLHINYLTFIIVAAFIAHTGFAIHLAFKRWQIWNLATKILLIGFYIIFLSFFIYLEKYYQKQPPTSKPIEQNQTAFPSPQATVAELETKYFTLSELAKFDGENGQPAYVAVDGIVYDLTSVFQLGKHYSHLAGKELTEAFYSYHAKNAITKYPSVGKLSL